jgi:hypothetical protein
LRELRLQNLGWHGHDKSLERGRVREKCLRETPEDITQETGARCLLEIEEEEEEEEETKAASVIMAAGPSLT